MVIEIKIVESIKAYEEDIDRRLREGTLEKADQGMIMTADTFCKIFTPERIRLLKRINRNNFTSIYQLAKELDKPYEVVFRNIKYLEGMGLIRIRTKANRKIPMIADRFEIDMYADVPA